MTIAQSTRSGWRGYISPRPVRGSRTPQHVQNLVIRDYAQRNGLLHRNFQGYSTHADCDLIGLGVASFSHAAGVHFQNLTEMEPYLAAVARGELPLKRAFRTSAEERMIREFILRMKLGRVDLRRFAEKFGVDLRARFAEPLARLAAEGVLEHGDDAITLSRDGLLRVDSLLHEFFLPRHRTARFPARYRHRSSI